MMDYNDSPLISVIIPVYNVERYLPRCLDSVVNQTYRNLEIFLINDGSTDRGPEICDEYASKDPRIVVIHKENGGVSDARNRAIDVMTGSYVTFIDSDDYVDEDYVETLYNMIAEDNTELSICSHQVIYDTGKNIRVATGERSVPDSKTALERILYDEGIPLSPWSKLYSSRLFENIRFPVGRVYEDAATIYKLVDLCDRVSLYSVSKYNYMIRSNSISTSKFTSKKMDLITATSEMTTYIAGKYPDLQKACDRRLMYAYLSTLSQLVKDPDKHEEEAVLMDYIMTNRKKVLKDRRIPRRDRLALHSLFGGIWSYRIMWKLYSKITRRE